MANNSIFNFRRVAQATHFSLAGLRWLALNEAAFRQELALFAALLVLSAFLDFSAASFAIQTALMSFVLVVEALNTAIEKLVDRISLDSHPLSGLIKDIASGAVTLSFIPLAAFWLGSLFA